VLIRRDEVRDGCKMAAWRHIDLMMRTNERGEGRYEDLHLEAFWETLKAGSLRFRNCDNMSNRGMMARRLELREGSFIPGWLLLNGIDVDGMDVEGNGQQYVGCNNIPGLGMDGWMDGWMGWTNKYVLYEITIK